MFAAPVLDLTPSTVLVTLYGNSISVSLDSFFWDCTHRSGGCESRLQFNGSSLTILNVELQGNDSYYSLTASPPSGSVANISLHTIRAAASSLSVALAPVRVLAAGKTPTSSFSIAVHESDFQQLALRHEIDGTGSPDASISSVLVNQTRLSGAPGHQSSLSLERLRISSCRLNQLKLGESIMLSPGLSKFLEQPSVSITNCTFSSESRIYVGYISIPGYNVTLRGNAIAPSNGSTSQPFIEMYSHENGGGSWVDARANYWGDREGPRSCCNPSSLGAVNIWADASSWCIDENCLELHSPPGNNSLSLTLTLPPWCQFEQICFPATTAIQYVVIGCFCGFATLSLLLAFLYIRKTRFSGRQSKMLLSEAIPPAAKHSTLYVLNICGAAICAVVGISAFFPTFYLSDSGLPSKAVRTWAVYASGFIVSVCSIRLIVNVWNFLILVKSPTTYKSLLPNVVLSSITVFLVFLWRFSALALESNRELLSSDIIIRTSFYWTMTATLAGGEIFFSIPIVVLSLHILKQRDFSAIEAMKQAVSGSPLGGVQQMLQPENLRRVSTFGWVFSMIMFLYNAACVFFCSMVLFPSLQFSNDRISTSLLGVSASIHFAAFAVVSIFGVLYFRYRTHDASYGTIFLALCVATSCAMAEVFSYEFIWEAQFLGWYIIQETIMAIGMAGMLVLASVSAWIILKLRRTLSADMARNAYNRFEEALGTN